ncbi:MAG: helix-turn-helix domain-containing protein [Dysgonomonas sp.]
MSRRNNENMLFTEFIKQSREQLQLPQRKLAEALDIDTATYCKIEKGERRVKREQIRIVAEVLNVNELELRTLWLADQVVEIMENEQDISDNVLDLVKENVKK